MNRIAGLALAAALSAATTAPLQARCWQQPELAAARMRDLQTMLMASTLRCRAAGHDVTAHYDAFVASRRADLDRANATIMAHFAGEGGRAAYDRFAAALASAYGAAATTPSACDEAAQTADDAADSSEALLTLANERIDPPQTAPGGCGREAPTIIAMAGAPERADVRVPAMRLARYEQSRTAPAR